MAAIIGILLIITVVLISGCIQPNGDKSNPQNPTGDIKSEQDVQKSIKNITSDLGDLEQALKELDTSTFG